MSLNIKVDYHFHPNLSVNKGIAKRKIKHIYKKFSDLGISVVLITEHVYKNPKRAYEMMKAECPEGFWVFPGMEYITKDGIDIVLFSESSKIYDYKELKPFNLDYEETIEFIENHDDVYGYVTHPFAYGKTGLVHNKGMSFTMEMCDRLGAIEISNCSLNPIRSFLNKCPYPVKRAFNRIIHRIDLNEDFPREFYPLNIKFLAAGSDAHHVNAIGTHCIINIAGELNADRVFSSIIHNSNPNIVMIHQKVMPTKIMMRGITSLREYIKKSGVRMKVRIKK